MHYPHVLPALPFASSLPSTSSTSNISLLPSASPTPEATYLIANALVTKNTATPGVSDTQVATIGNFTDLAYTILPPRFDGGTHNAPVPQLVHFLSGVA